MCIFRRKAHRQNFHSEDNKLRVVDAEKKRTMSLERHQRAVRASQNKSPSRDLEKVRRDKEWDHSKGAGSRKAGGEEGGKMTKSGFSLTISPMMTITPRKQHTHTHTRTRTRTHTHTHTHAHTHYY